MSAIHRGCESAMCAFTLTEIHYDRPVGGFSKCHPDEAYTIKVRAFLL